MSPFLTRGTNTDGIKAQQQHESVYHSYSTKLFCLLLFVWATRFDLQHFRVYSSSLLWDGLVMLSQIYPEHESEQVFQIWVKGKAWADIAPGGEEGNIQNCLIILSCCWYFWVSADIKFWPDTEKKNTFKILHKVFLTHKNRDPFFLQEKLEGIPQTKYIHTSRTHVCFF